MTAPGLPTAARSATHKVTSSTVRVFLKYGQIVVASKPNRVERVAIRWGLFIPVCLLGLAPYPGQPSLQASSGVGRGSGPPSFCNSAPRSSLAPCYSLCNIPSSRTSVGRPVRWSGKSVPERTRWSDRSASSQVASTRSHKRCRPRERRHAEEDLALAAITDEMTYDALSSARSKAPRNVEPSPSPFGYGPLQTWVECACTSNFSTRWSAGGARNPFISLTPWFPDGRGVQRDSWSPNEDVAAVMNRIVDKLESANLDATTNTFDPRLVFENLRASLVLAVRSLRGDLERRLRGPLIELIDDRWVLTDEGLESRTDDVFVSIDIFPGTLPRFRIPGRKNSRKPPPAPNGVPEETWQTLVTIARKTYLFHGKRSIRRKGFS